MRVQICTGLLLAIGTITAWPQTSAERNLGRVIPGESLRVVGFGDFGTGSDAQHEVADAIARRHAQQPFNLGLTFGDNFYRCGVRSVTDKKWTERWENLYTPLGIPFYATLGNHDYGMPRIICPFGGASAKSEIAYTQYSQSWRMPANYYSFAAGPVRFVAIDTEGWSKEQLAWIDSVLKETAGEPGVSWRIVYGHHPMLTSGKHLNERRIGRLRRELLPVLKQNQVDLYISGHDHDLEHLSYDGMEFLIAGGGGAKLRSLAEREPTSQFSLKAHAFLDLTITPNELTAEFLAPNLMPLETPPLVLRK